MKATNSKYGILKKKMDDLGVKVPVLYKQYVELCQPGGCEFLGFNIDPKFSNCIDALISGAYQQTSTPY